MMKLPQSLLGQTLAFAVASVVLGLGNVWLNPEALHLGRDYFPGGSQASSTQKLEHEFQTIGAEELHSYLDLLYDEPPYVMVLDARSEGHYRRGHIPGSYLLDQYHQEATLSEIMPILEQAPQVVVYCTGGDCEDSIFLCRSLVYDHGILQESLYIFEGGSSEWKELGYPMKEGDER